MSNLSEEKLLAHGVQSYSENSEKSQLVDNTQIVSEISPLSPGISSRLSWAQRTFSPMGQGSVRGSIFALIATAMGSGLLALPENAAQNGIVYALSVIIIAGLLALTAMYFLAEMGQKTKITNYSVLVEHCLGKKMKTTLEIIVIIYCWGCILSYQIAIAQFVVGIFGYWMDVYIDQDDPSQGMNSTGNLIRWLTNIILIIPNLPFSLMRNLYNLRYMTIFSMVSLMYIQITFIVLFFVHLEDQVIPLSKQTKYFEWNFQNLLSSYANTVFTYLCHQSIFPLMSELQRPSLERCHKIFNRAVSFEIIFYCSFTIFAYFLLQQGCQPLVIDSTVSPQVTMLISKFAMNINLFFAIPLTLNPARTNLYTLINRPKPAFGFHFIITSAFLVTSCALAIFYPQAKKVFGVLGGTAGTIIAFTLPGWMYILLSNKPYFKGLNLCIIIIDTIATLGGFAGAITSVIPS